MRPARQGDFDGLCGLYALINSLQLVTARRQRSPLNQRIFAALSSALPCRKLRAGLSSEGLEGADLVKAARATFPSFERNLGGALEITRPFRRCTFATDEAFAAKLAELVSQPSSAVIVLLATPAFGHWTVVQAVHPSAYVVKDSWRFETLPRDRYTIKRGSYRIRPRETLLVRLQQSQITSAADGGP